MGAWAAEMKKNKKKRGGRVVGEWNWRPALLLVGSGTVSSETGA